MVNPRRIRYITGAFGSLRGLRRLPFGGYYLLGALYDGWIIPSGYHGAGLYPLWPLFAALPFVALLLTALVGLYYMRAFGAVVARPPATTAAPFSRRWLWVPAWGAVALVLTFNTGHPPPAAALWLALGGYAALLLGACAAPARTPGAAGPIPAAPVILIMLVVGPFPGYRPISTLGVAGGLLPPPGVNNAVAQDLILALFFIGSGVYNHLQLTRTLRRVAEDIRGRSLAAI